MFSRSAAQFSLVIAFACVFAATNPCEAQQTERSLFVIKTPEVQQSGYGQRPGAIVFTPVSHQQEQATPREDDGLDDIENAAMKELNALEDLEEDRDDLPLDDFDSNPPEAPMTTWNLKPMSSIAPGLRPVNGKSPADQSWQLTNRSSMPSVNSDKLFAWAAPDITYKPLYFEDVALERYGQTKGFFKQPFVSGFNFLKSAAFLPYYSLYDPINSCDGPLGYCRPGDHVNCVQNKHYFGNPFAGRR